ncbi:MAG TPA: 16S rRNA pseudouridine(516) synthase [Lachnospiraceae bacterium]|nr:16S rRNA pseudouridine(516) synthase [Lachnospiraceae bacterium]
MRLDKFLCEMKIGTRSQVKDYIRQGLVAVNGIPAKSADRKIDENADKVAFRDRILQYRKYSYYMLNKPAGMVSATVDNTADTVVSLLKEEMHSGDIFPVGRLDKDVTGLLLLTNDGELAHRLLSPARHVDKTYQVTLEHPLSPEDIGRLESGVDIGEEKLTLPAQVSVVTEDVILLTIHEGKYHQVKRMLLAVGNGVRSLKRISFGALRLDETLKEGEYRELTPEEIGLL